MDYKSKIAFKNVNVMDRVEPAPYRPIPPATMIRIYVGRTQEFTKARIIDFSRRMSVR